MVRAVNAREPVSADEAARRDDYRRRPGVPHTSDPHTSDPHMSDPHMSGYTRNGGVSG
jgi:hypothetical protein